MHKFRAFISYSRKDFQLVQEVVQVLEAVPLDTVWDRGIRPGTPFAEAIKEQVASAHLFIPILTKNSAQSSWVHQETGLAIGAGIPVLPIAFDIDDPGQMIAEIQVLKLEGGVGRLRQSLQEMDLQSIVAKPPRMLTTLRTADYPEQRAEAMVQYARQHLELGQTGCVRQRAVFSSFSLPGRGSSDEEWKKYNPKHRTSEFLMDFLEQERELLVAHTLAGKCKLIINPFIESIRDSTVHEAHITQLLRFLNSNADDTVDIVVSSKARKGNLTIVGDRFAAQAFLPRPGAGYGQTTFYTHGPTVYQLLVQFDDEFQRLISEKRLQENESSRARAIHDLEDRLKEVSSDLSS